MKIRIAQNDYERALFRRNSILKDWAESAKARDYTDARMRAEVLEEADREVYHQGGSKLTISDLTAALEAASIPWYNDVCAEYIEN